MSEFLVRPGRFTDRIENFRYEYLSFEARKLAQGRKYEGDTGGNELAMVVLGGVCSVETPQGAWQRIGRRRTVFDGLPYTLYLPVSTSFSISADTESDLAFCYCRPEEHHPPRLMTHAPLRQ